MKWVGDQLVAGGALGLWSGAVDWIDWRSMKVTRSLHAGAFTPARALDPGRSLAGEGMAIEGSDLYLLPEDGPARLFHFKLDTPPNVEATS